jgi:transcriptional regulator with XRE-family HTH domain
MANRNPRSARTIDVHIGKRLRDARKALDMSQTTLANLIGITFQQVQKYEKGTNRISAGRLYEVAHALELPITFFFDGFKLPQVARHRRAVRLAAG